MHVCNPVSECSVIALQLQKLKRSLSFKTKSLRSKSADNFFQRNSDSKLPGEMLSEDSPSSSPLPASGSLTSTPTRTGLHSSSKNHTFQEHIFKKPTFCDICNHMIVGKVFSYPCFQTMGKYEKGGLWPISLTTRLMYTHGHVIGLQSIWERIFGMGNITTQNGELDFELLTKPSTIPS